MKDLHLVCDQNKRHLRKEVSEIERVQGKVYQSLDEPRDYTKYEPGQKDDLIRCPVCWKDWPVHQVGRCSCGCYFDSIKIDTWKEDFWLEEHYRFLRLQRGAIFDDHMKVSLEEYYNEFYRNLSAEYILKHL